MKIRMAHVRIQGISVAIFDANSVDDTDSGRQDVLANLTGRARLAGYRVDKAALAYRNRFYGTPDLVRYLSRGGQFRWTHEIDA